MKCKTTYSSERTKKLCIDCSKCGCGGSLDSPECMRKAIDLIRMNQVEEIKFMRKDYSELYTKKEVESPGRGCGRYPGVRRPQGMDEPGLRKQAG